MNAEDFVATVLAVVAEIPPGRVMTYGGVAEAMGSRAPRAVGKVLAHHGHTTHWWRVIPASGKPPAGHEAEALAAYRAEGTPLRWAPGAESYRVVLREARFVPDTDDPGAPFAAELPPLPPSIRG
ncbi:MGMT family protein [Leucobacter sp. M11]|uniref:MGMT family protein n=1 Tax=Leucobacter sp. M11 TaxID=2993565 RepID=UPI002D7FC7D3|nr:MGMT family protein [Leucobacter sp. M11]MEB4614506.1 MGMT family protein [Leucobacter sp. M11]